MSAAGVLPVLLGGALAVQIKEDLSLSDGQIGIALAMFSGVGALAALRGGPFSDRHGWDRAVRVAAALSAISLLGISLFGTRYVLLALFLAVGGVAVSIGMPAANLIIVRELPVARHGTLFGIKQTAVPIATFLAGLSVPLLALTVGWRWVFVAGLSMPAATWLSLRGMRPSAQRVGGRAGAKSEGRIDRGPILMLAIAGGLAMVAVGGLVAYAVGWGWPGLFHFGVVTGHPEAPASATGYVQAGSAAGSTLGPLLFGALADASGHALSWTVATAAAVAGGILMLVASRRVAGRQRPAGPPGLREAM